jgi:drug/metabolite transporter (DMT)-like permease
LYTKAAPYIILLGSLFGTSLVVSRLVIDQIAPTTFIGLRFGIAGFAFSIIFTMRIGNRRWPRGSDLWRHSFILGLFGSVLPMMGIVSALQYLSSGMVSILITVNPAFTVIMANSFLYDEPLTRRKGGGVLLALTGAVMLIILGENGLPEVNATNPLGYLLILSSMLAGSAMTVYTRKYMQKFDTFDVTGLRLIFGAVIAIPFSALVDGFDLTNVDTQGIFALLFAAFVGTLIGMLLSLYNIQRFGATVAAMTTYVIPIVASLVGVIFLKEEITWGMIGGISIILLGVWVISIAENKKIPIPYV